MTSKKKTVVTKNESTALAAMNAELMEGLNLPETSSNDIVIPKILPMQPGSPQVVDRKSDAKFGDMCDSVSGDKMGDVDTPLVFVPICVERIWLVYKMETGGREFKKMVPLCLDKSSPNYNDDWEWEYTDTSGDYRRYRTYNFYVLLRTDMEEFEKAMLAEHASLESYLAKAKTGKAPQGPIPFIASFRSTSMMAGKNLYTQMYTRNVGAGKPPFAERIELSLEEDSNDDGTWVKFITRKAGAANLFEMFRAKYWNEQISTGKTKADDSDLNEEPAKEAPSTGVADNAEF